jgi:hypothetical protein
MAVGSRQYVIRFSQGLQLPAGKSATGPRLAIESTGRLSEERLLDWDGLLVFPRSGHTLRSGNNKRGVAQNAGHAALIVGRYLAAYDEYCAAHASA